MNTYIEWGALANVVIAGLVVGAGLPALFAVGVRALAGPGSRDADGQRPRVRVISTSVRLPPALILAIGVPLLPSVV